MLYSVPNLSSVIKMQLGMIHDFNGIKIDDFDASLSVNIETVYLSCIRLFYPNQMV